jgi:transcriptional regulator
MYEPPLHRQDDLAAQHDLIRRHPLGLLVSHGPQGLVANAIPFLVDAGA